MIQNLADDILRSKREIPFKLSSVDIHIDNGGLQFDVIANICDNGKDPVILNTELKFTASYFGYPSIMSIVNGGLDVDADRLQAMGLALIEAATKLRDLNSRKNTFSELIVALVNEGKIK